MEESGVIIKSCYRHLPLSSSFHPHIVSSETNLHKNFTCRGFDARRTTFSPKTTAASSLDVEVPQPYNI